MAESLHLVFRFLLYLAVTAVGITILIKTDRLSVRLLTLAGAVVLVIWNNEIAGYLTACVMAILSLLLKIVLILLLLILLVRVVLGIGRR